MDHSSHNQEVKDYLDRRFGQEDVLLHTIRSHSQHEKLPSIHIPIHIGKFISLLAKIQSSQKILEIGTLGGYSTAWLAKALKSGGRIVSLEINPFHADLAKENLKFITHVQVDIRIGHAVDLLSQMVENKEGPFDFIFIDADKENNVLYLEWCLKLSRPGTLILIDNLIPKGSVAGYPAHEEAKTVYAFNDYLAQHSQLETVAIPSLVGQQGRLDALAIARVKH